MKSPELIYCADGNKRFADIAIETGFTYGAQIPNTIYRKIEFADQDWKKPRRAAYMDALKKHRPRIATVLDLEHLEQIDEVLSWAEDAAQYVQTVIIIPKVFDAITKLPRTIAGADIRLGYSVPTKFAGTDVPIWEFSGWPVHLLGGSPQRQYELAQYLDVRSIDGNMAKKIAFRWSGVWVNGTARYAKNRYWPALWEYTGERNIKDAPYRAFALSCRNIMEFWKNA